jgi:hypothetical protein
MTHFDDHGLPLSTSSETAAEHYRAGVLLMLSAWPGGGEELERAIAADPGFALAWAALARLRTIHARPADAKEAIATAVDLVSRQGTERERSHVAVLDAAIAGRTLQARDLALAHADRWPRDVLILGMALGPFGLLAFSGMAGHEQALVDLCAHHADHFDADDWWFLTYHGWALAENGEAGRGRSMLERALLLRRENAYGHDVPATLWQELRAYAAGKYPEAVGHGFIDVHMAIIEASTRDREALERRARSLAEMAAAGTLAKEPSVLRLNDAA